MSERVAVIGTGVMGQNHLRTLHSFTEADVTVSRVVDADMDRAQTAIDQSKSVATATTDLGSVTRENTDAAIIATPSHFHAEQAIELMERGIHVLVEKPIALNDSDVAAMQRVASEHGTVLMAGHVELFNPTVKALGSLLGHRAIKSMRFKRLSNVADRSRLYHDVVSDLMLHDLTIAQQLAGDSLPARELIAHGSLNELGQPDPAEAIVRYGEGVDAHFRASRNYAGGKVRTIEVETDTHILTADLLARSIVVQHSSEGEMAPDGVFMEDMQRKKFYPGQTAQPLTLEQQHFFDSIHHRVTPEDAGVSAEHARRILKLTTNILRIINADHR